MTLQVGDYAGCDRYPTLFGTIVRIADGFHYYVRIDQSCLRGADEVQWGGIDECHGSNWYLIEAANTIQTTIDDNAAYYHAITGEI